MNGEKEYGTCNEKQQQHQNDNNGATAEATSTEATECNGRHRQDVILLHNICYFSHSPRNEMPTEDKIAFSIQNSTFSSASR